MALAQAQAAFASIGERARWMPQAGGDRDVNVLLGRRVVVDEGNPASVSAGARTANTDAELQVGDQMRLSDGSLWKVAQIVANNALGTSATLQRVVT